MGVSPINLKKKRCSRHFKPMDRSAGSRRRSLANLREETASGDKRSSTDSDELLMDDIKHEPLFTAELHHESLILVSLLSLHGLSSLRSFNFFHI